MRQNVACSNGFISGIVKTMDDHSEHPKSNPSVMFSPEIVEKMGKSLAFINQLTLMNNQQIKTFRQRSGTMNPDLQDLATIVGAQVAVLEEKYTVLFDLVNDLYSKLEQMQKGPPL